MAAGRDTVYFARLMDALAPWLDQVVVIGGWAHRLYRLHPLAQTLDYEPLATFDADVAVPAQLPVAGLSIHQRLIASGFEAERLGDAQPPATHYRLAGGESGFYAEFLTPLLKGAIKRSGASDRTARIAGVSTQKMRHLELLLRSPWNVEIASANGYPTSEIRRVRLPNPASYLAQKILIHRNRERADRAKDILYIHDTIETFGGAILPIRQVWELNVRPTMHPNSIRQVERAATALFGEVNDSIREAALIAASRNLTPESVREVCSYGWSRIFTDGPR